MEYCTCLYFVNETSAYTLLTKQIMFLCFEIGVVFINLLDLFKSDFPAILKGSNRMSSIFLEPPAEAQAYIAIFFVSP